MYTSRACFTVALQAHYYFTGNRGNHGVYSNNIKVHGHIGTSPSKRKSGECCIKVDIKATLDLTWLHQPIRGSNSLV